MHFAGLRGLVGLVTLILAVVAGMTGAARADRLALVIGIDNYANVTNLKKARNDATAISAALQNAGFEVQTGLDLSRRELIVNLARFAGQITPGDEVVFYFAGHGVEVQGRNYLLPADVPAVRPGDEILLTAESVPSDQVLSMFQRKGARLSFLVLDACRNNPFPKAGLRSVGGEAGLADIDKELLPVGTFILYSAGVGQTALDRLSDADTDPNSVFTRSLLPLIEEPGLSLGDLTRRVRSDVRRLARSVGHEQFPSYYDQIDVDEGEFFFRQPEMSQPPSIGYSDPPEAPTDRGSFKLDENGGETLAIPKPRTTDNCGEAASLWEAVKHSQSREVFQSFANKYADCGIFAGLARERLAEIEGSSAVEPTPAPTPAPAPTVSSGDVCFDLWYKRNAIFHRYGYCFQTEKAQRYFSNANCTTRNPKLTSADLQEVERLRALERQNGC